MSKKLSPFHQDELRQLREFSARVGSDPLLTQASTGNSSIKLDGVLWIKASGKWMANALDEGVLVPLELADIHDALKRNLDPTQQFAQASIETAMHAVLPHPVVIHLHSVNALAWAVRRDAPAQLARLLDGLRWHWIPHVPSGLPLAREIEKVLCAPADCDVLVLGNHGLVLAGGSCRVVEGLLSEVEARLAVSPRVAAQADLATLTTIAESASWRMPDDEHVHTLATDSISQFIVSSGLLFPTQSTFSSSTTLDLFQPMRCPDPEDHLWDRHYRSRAFLIIENRGVILSPSITEVQRALLSGLAHIVQRIPPRAPIRYLTEEEVAGSYAAVATRHCESLSASRNV
ncbi:MAG TPA: class II aldolase/adducin family protein [Candidatus Saccharimonadales bacterium]|nr:class II aldolase/adducin family protein [Candidatus Saccharimonadales bacterium]